MNKTTTTPKVSVLMPAYNVEKYIDEAIQSILNQSFTDFEFIIVDDCSTDKTWEIIQKYAQKDSRITAKQNKINLGISSTRNYLILLCDTESKYAIWQDSDDISLPERIRHQYDFMENNPDVGICGGYLQYFDETGELSLRKYAETDTEIRKTIFRYSPVAQPSSIIRKECFAVTGMFPLASPVAEDLAMSFQIGTKYKFANLPEILIKYRQVNNGATFSKLHIMELYTIFLRVRYASLNQDSYKMSLFDKLFNTAQYLTIFLIPPKIKIAIFNFFRNS